MDEPTQAPELIFDLPAETERPRHYRTCLDAFKRASALPVPREGLAELRVSGSAQPTHDDLAWTIARLGGNVIVADLRQESHAFVNGNPVAWYVPRNVGNEGADEREVLEREARLTAALKGRVRVVHPLSKDLDGNIAVCDVQYLDVVEALTESEDTAHLGLGYARFAVTDHCRPSDDEARRFTAFYLGLPQDAWLHLHCHGGEGRTTSFMIMCDILKNGRRFTLEEYAARQYLLGGEDVLHVRGLSYKAPLYAKRIEFLREFYQTHAG